MSPIKSSTLDKIAHNPQQTIFFLLNTPNRMDGELIEEVNSAMHEVIPELKRFAEDNLDYSIKFCCMDFGHSPRWMGCADILDYVWLDVLSTSGNALGGGHIISLIQLFQDKRVDLCNVILIVSL